jgi:16S rRNA (uracil1498-N3)-methyltransferase
MSAHRFFLTGPLARDDARLLPLSESDAHHAVNVLRLRAGEVIDVVEPDTHVWRVRVEETGPDGVRASVIEPVALAPQPRVTLFQGVAKGEKMDLIVRQAVEVGAEQIVPVLTARSVVQLDARKRSLRTERWRRVAEAAAKQAKRVVIPRIADAVNLRDALPMLSDYDAVIVLWEECVDVGIEAAIGARASSEDARIALVVGPEGGLSAEEVESLRTIGAISATLGPSILRTETAAVVALALAVSALGGLGGSRG